MASDNMRCLIAVILGSCVLLTGCASPMTPVIDKLDEDTGVTVTYSRTPFVFSPNERADDHAASEFVQVGAIEINTMGALKYYLWLGISEAYSLETTEGHPQGFETVVFDIDGKKISLDVRGWSHEAIGTSAPIYKKLFKSTKDAYYEVSLDHVAMLIDATDVSFSSSGPAARTYRPWYRSVTPNEDLTEFHKVVLE